MPLETKYYKLEKLVKWVHVDQVNQMLLTGISPHQVSAWCKDNGFSISHPKLYEYKEMLQTAIQRNITVERLLGIGVPKRKPIVLQALGMGNSTQFVKNEMELLDLVIQRGYDSALLSNDIKIDQALKAIDLKNKLTSGAHGGLTGYGLDMLRELEQAKFQAIVAVVLKYLPEDKHPELEEAIAQAERAYYEEYAPELLEQYEQAAKGDIVVSDSPY